MSADGRRKGPAPFVCLVCGHEVEHLDQLPPVVATGPGWIKRETTLLAACSTCGTVRARARFDFELDLGDHPKRSLR